MRFVAPFEMRSLGGEIAATPRSGLEQTVTTLPKDCEFATDRIYENKSVAPYGIDSTINSQSRISKACTGFCITATDMPSGIRSAALISPVTIAAGISP